MAHGLRGGMGTPCHYLGMRCCLSGFGLFLQARCFADVFSHILAYVLDIQNVPLSPLFYAFKIKLIKSAYICGAGVYLEGINCRRVLKLDYC